MSFRLARMAAAAVLASALMAASASAATPSAYVYATSWSQTVRQYAADDAGVLSPLTPPRWDRPDVDGAAAASPDRRSLYVVNQASTSVSQFDIGRRRDAHAEDAGFRRHRDDAGRHRRRA